MRRTLRLPTDVLPRFLWGDERRRRIMAVVLLLGMWMAASSLLSAHGVSGRDARYLLSLNGPAPIPLMYLGAKHMVRVTTTCSFWSA